MIGHMIFKKNLDSEDKLGLKVIGGQLLSNNRLGAIVEKVKRGSIADQEGHIKPGNDVKISSHIVRLFASSHIGQFDLTMLFSVYENFRRRIDRMEWPIIERSKCSRGS